jgi:N-acyl-L-homoserine lactone synthetase
MTVTVFDFASAPFAEHPGIVRDLFRFRKKVFTDGQRYTTPVWDGMEHDELDTPSAVYFVRYGESGSVLGMIRLNPTKYTNFEGSMINNSFRKTVDGPVPHGEEILEATRIGVAPELSANPELRNQVVSELVLATLEYAVIRGADYMIGIMPPGFWKSVYEKRDWPMEPLGTQTQQYGADPVRDAVSARRMLVSADVLRRVRNATGIHTPVSEFVQTLEVTNLQTGKKNPFELVAG